VGGAAQPRPRVTAPPSFADWISQSMVLVTLPPSGCLASCALLLGCAFMPQPPRDLISGLLCLPVIPAGLCIAGRAEASSAGIIIAWRTLVGCVGAGDTWSAWSGASLQQRVPHLPCR